ncbi:MAG: hypothetical protein V9G21_06945 [Methylotenera sp.]|jgi:SMC interacting uncharacterized protein involved in chromosome segregation|nr:hypothetical protein [Methylotenera sp.]HPH08984.1 hypothetical protein [Methylotenera sp.]HPM50173.1 hypothetical protein [Methylotenera sp.]HQM86412.1 hypothetical protein [Methylotenera sp.]
MTKQEKFKRDIESLSDSIKLDWQDIASKQLSLEEKQGIIQHIKWCISELKELHERLEIEG